MPRRRLRRHPHHAVIDAVLGANPRSGVVLETGGPGLTPWRGRPPAVLQAWYPGVEGGTAIARVLFGDVDPGGRLPATFPRRAADLPTAGDPEKYPGVSENVHDQEGVRVGYRWYDEKGLPVAYPYGHGLSYTTFAYRDLVVTRGTREVGATVEATLINTGDRPGYAVPQVYVRMPSPDAGVEQRPRQLKGFTKVRLRPGESRRVSFHPGVLLGSSSRDIRLRARVPVGGGCGADPQSSLSRA